VPEPLVVVAGENLVDRIEHPDGRTDEIAGGGPFNTARALARLGCRVAYLGRISTDDRGRRLRSLLTDDGVDLSLAASSDDPTLIARATLDVAGGATYRFEWQGSAAAGLRLDDLAGGLPRDTAALHVGSLGLVLEPMASAIEQTVASAAPNVLVMADPNIRADAVADRDSVRARVSTVLARADVIKASTEDLAWLDATPGPDAAPRPWAPHAARGLLLVTDGPRPVRVAGRTWERTVEVPRVSVVDTIGAGDVFGAAFLAACLEPGGGRIALDDPDAVEASVRFAIRASAWTVGRRGAEPPSRDDLAGQGPMR
jgi:fructokinase